MRLKWLGTATILIEQDGVRLLFDPFLSRNDKTFKPSVNELAEAEKIFVTHGHLDHIVDIPAIMERNDGRATIYCTQTPRKTLISKGVDSDRIHAVKPGDVFLFPPFEIRVLRGRHIVFDAMRIIQTFLNPRMIRYMKNLRDLLKENRASTESGETLIYEISVPGERILLLGSLNLDDDAEYPEGVDLLILPFQGRSDITRYAVKFIERLRPKKVFLDHFDDTFPPVSSRVKTARFIHKTQRDFPAVTVICRQAGPEWIVCDNTDRVHEHLAR